MRTLARQRFSPLMSCRSAATTNCAILKRVRQKARAADAHNVLPLAFHTLTDVQAALRKTQTACNVSALTRASSFVISSAIVSYLFLGGERAGADGTHHIVNRLVVREVCRFARLTRQPLAV